jgi:general secretion pathway protein B
MSLILEALRRSEAERQLGHAPDVLTPMPVLRTSRRTRYWPWWVALALVLTALALWGMWRLMQQRSPSSTLAIATNAPAVPAQPHLTVHAVPNAASETRPAITNAVRVTAAQAPSHELSLVRPHASDVDAASTNTVGASMGQAATAAAARVATPPPIIQASAPADIETPPASADALLSIADLSPAERAGLPALKVSMHVYAEQPGDRFMIVDGARVGEGARIGDRIVLVQIRRDGGVLDIGGRRMLLPKP